MAKKDVEKDVAAVEASAQDTNVQAAVDAVGENAKVKAFQAFLDEQGIDSFTVETMEDEAQTVLFRSNIEMSGQILPMAVIIDRSVFTIIRLELFRGFDMERKGDMTDYLNEVNADFKMFKYYLRTDGLIYIDLCLPFVDETFDPKMIQLMLNVLIQHLSGTYKAFMAKVWERK